MPWATWCGTQTLCVVRMPQKVLLTLSLAAADDATIGRCVELSLWRFVALFHCALCCCCICVVNIFNCYWKCDSCALRGHLSFADGAAVAVGFGAGVGCGAGSESREGEGEGLSCGSANCNIDGGTCLVRLIGLQVLHEQHVAPSCCCCSQLLSLLLVLHDKSVENVAA